MLMNKKFFVTLLTTALFLISGTFTALASDLDGSFDDFEGNTIVGWGWDSTQPNTAVPVTVTITNKETGEQVKSFHQTAITYRSDLEGNGVGNGRHGFRIAMNWDTLPDGTYLIEGNVDGKALSNPKTYTKGEAAKNNKEESNASGDAHDHEHTATGLKSLGFFRTTGYCPCKQCSEGWGRRTSTGSIAKSSHTIAVDPRIIPYGSKVMIGGVIYTAEDRGGGVKGNHVDIFFDTHAQTRQHGKQTQEVFLVLG